MAQKRLTVVQMLPALDGGGVEKGTLEVARHLVAHGHRSIVISAGGRMVEQLLREGSEHIAWDVGAKRLKTLRHIRPLRRLLAEQQVDILHLRSRLPAWIGWWAWRGLPAANGPRLVTTVHGLYAPGRYSSIMTRGERVIAVSNTVRDYILANYPKVDPAVIRVIPRGVDPAVYRYGFQAGAGWLAAWQTQYPQLIGKRLIALPARLTRLKGHDDFIRIMRGLKARGLPVHGLIVGGTHPRKQAYEQELRATVHAAGLDDDITFTGHRGDLREIMSICSAVLALSTQPEAFGRVALEALSLGVPVLGYAHGGIGEQLAASFAEGAITLGDVAAAEARLAEWLSGEPPRPRAHEHMLERMLQSTLETYLELVRT